MTVGCKYKTTSGLFAITSLVFLYCSHAFSAIQGEAGAESSTATTTITLTLQPSIQISNVGDIVLNVTDRSQDLIAEERICVRGNVGGRYSVIAAGQDGGKNPFQLRSTSGDSIAYQLFFRGDLTAITSDELSPGQASPFYSMKTQNPDCNGEDSAAFSLLFKSSDLLPDTPGTYGEFLTLTVAAE